MTRTKKTLLFVALLSGILLGVRLHGGKPAPGVRSAAAVNVEPSPVTTAHDRINYPYSLIPYGVQTLDELKRALADDPVLAAHYRDFDFDNANFVVMDHDSCAYVSFRRAGKISWTQKCIPIHRGEAVLTDARYMVRALCGNQISYRPQAPASPVDIDQLGPPAPIAVPAATPGDGLRAGPPVTPGVAPVPAPLPVTPFPGVPSPGTPPVTVAGGPPTPPILIPPYGGVTCCKPYTPPPHPPKPPGPPGPPGPPVNVPEGDYSGMLVLTAVLIVAAFYAKHRWN